VGAFTTGEGFAAIVPMHAPAMLRVATALIDPVDAEDAVQEAAMRAHGSSRSPSTSVAAGGAA
jgi:DNA-directed RNA polymerase specialized sigma24 family protein